MATQAQLDGWFGTTPAERAAMRSGELPPRLREGQLQGAGCLGIALPAAFIATGAVLGIGLRFLLHFFGVTAGPTPAQLAVLGALGGAALGLRARRKVASRGDRFSQVTVANELLELAAQPAEGSVVPLRASDGRGFRAVLPIAELAGMAGTYRVYYIDLAQLVLMGMPASTDRLLLALENPKLKNES